MKRHHALVVVDPPGPRSRELCAREAPLLAPGTQTLSQLAGIAIDRGDGATLVDADGNRYLDLVAGIGVAGIGHAHPRHARAVAEQAARISVGSFTSAARAALLEKLAAVLPPPLRRIQLYSGGAEAVEAALRLSRSHTGGHEVLGFWGGFHGKTGGVIGVTSARRGLGPVAPGTLLTPYADCYRCPFGATYPSCGLLCAEHARDTLRNASTGQLAAVIVEPVQGTAGNVIPPPGFLPAIREVAREAGAVFVVDEMITGCGRTGKLFAIQHEGIDPDVMTLGKALGGGYPISALAASEAVLARGPFIEPSASSSSYGGNPLAAAAALASLSIVQEEELPARAARVGAHMLARMQSWPDRFPVVGQVRGRGLLLGVELVADRRTREPLGKAALQRLFRAALRRGVLTMAYAPRWRINPPLVLEEEQADEALDLLEEVLAQTASGRVDGEVLG